ncbi:MAG: heme biosynthesis protein HemY [Proteobacteria bacterium]|nr:heme biosynthesis protein HemY [Pseudomonadota bacterium]
MRKIFVLVLIALLAGVAVVALIETDPGYVLITYGNYTLESSVWVGLLLLLLFTGLVYLSLRLIRKLLSGQSSLVSWFGNRKSRQAARLTTQGLISFIEGNWVKSRRQLLRGAKGNDAPLLNYLTAARASYRLNDVDKMREYLGAAEDSEAQAGIAVELTQAEMKLHAEQYEQALATLVRARRNAGKHPYVLDLMRKAYLGLNDWAKLAELLPEMKKYKILPEDKLLDLERTVYLQLLESSSAGDNAVADLHAQWQKLPSELRKDRDMGYSYVKLLVENGAFEAAEKVILRFLKKDWDAGFVRLYGLLEGKSPARQLAQAESWLAVHDRDVQLFICLGRLSARDSLWGKSRDYFEAGYRLEQSAEICAELGRLLYAMGEEKVAAAYFREGLLLRESALPELPVPDKAVSRSRRLAN